MLEDRYYMRGEDRSSRFSATAILMVTLVIAFALQQISKVYVDSFEWREIFALTNHGLKSGWLWQLITFQFLHVGPFHLIFNLLTIWVCGRPIEARLGKANFLKIYFASGIIGGLFQASLQLAFPAFFGTSVMGASAGACGLLAAFALIDPEAQFLVMFVLPIKARYLLVIETCVALFFTLVPSLDSQLAHAAHLGGIGAAYAFMKLGLYDYSPSFNWHPLRNRARRRQLVKAATIKPGFWRTKGSAIPKAEQIEPEEFISREVDPILDKISAQGIQSLTPREKQILEAARSKMDKR